MRKLAFAVFCECKFPAEFVIFSRSAATFSFLKEFVDAVVFIYYFRLRNCSGNDRKYETAIIADAVRRIAYLQIIKYVEGVFDE